VKSLRDEPESHITALGIGATRILREHSGFPMEFRDLAEREVALRLVPRALGRIELDLHTFLVTAKSWMVNSFP
jgi:hypothetical protein